MKIPHIEGGSFFFQHGVGLALGALLGDVDGALDGPLEGEPDGLDVGATEGKVVGVSDGVEDGARLGILHPWQLARHTSKINFSSQSCILEPQSEI